MSEIEKIERYIKDTKIPRKLADGYSICVPECNALYDVLQGKPYEGMFLLFQYGQAKGYRAAKAEVKK